MDAHPNVCVVDEMTTVQLYKRGMSKEEILEHTITRAKNQSLSGRKVGTGYEFPVAGQGETDRLLVVGEKGGLRALTNIDVLDDFKAHMNMHIRIIVPARNPLDNIASHLRSRKRKHFLQDRNSVMKYVLLFFKNYDKISSGAGRLANGYFHCVYLEDLIASPRSTLIEAARFIGVPCDGSWLDKCINANLLLEKPRRRFLECGELHHPAIVELARTESRRFPWIYHRYYCLNERISRTE